MEVAAGEMAVQRAPPRAARRGAEEATFVIFLPRLLPASPKRGATRGPAAV